jgi:hypothetical protein
MAARAHVDQHGLQGIVTVSYKTYRDTYRNGFTICIACGKSVSLHP